MRARQVKRTTLVIKLKQPYIQWANSLDDDGVKPGEDFEPGHRVYLVDDVSGFEIDVEARAAPVWWKNLISRGIQPRARIILRFRLRLTA